MDLTEMEAKEYLIQVVERQPDLMQDIVGRASARRGGAGPNPSPDPEGGQSRNFPDWCVCTRCREMTQDVEKLCCNMQPANCLSQREVSESYMSLNSIFQAQ